MTIHYASGSCSAWDLLPVVPDLGWPMKILRMTVVAACGTVAFCSLLATTAPRIRINVPAGNMQQTVAHFRDDFEKNYHVPRRPIPLFSMMYRSGIEPLNPADEARIGKTAAGQARVGAFSSDGKTITSDGVEAKGVVFQVLFQNKVSPLLVDCPANLSAQIDTDSSPGGNNTLRFTFNQPIKFHADPAALGLPVPSDVYLTSISLSDVALDYQFSTDATAGPGTVYELYLDLTKAPPSAR